MKGTFKRRYPRPYTHSAWLLAALLGCSGSEPAIQPPIPHPTTPPEHAVAEPPPPAQPPPEPLPPGVLARIREADGVVQVVERDGMRRLEIDSEVQAAQPLSGATGSDPLVQLLKNVRPNAKRVLLLGLGSGKTATDLRAAGFEVRVVDKSAAVIQLARKHFGYRGTAEHGDGLNALLKGEARYDVVIMDGWTPESAVAVRSAREMMVDEPPSARQQWRRALGNAALRALPERLQPNGVFVLRAVATPDSADLKRIRKKLMRGAKQRFVELLGDGVSDERQNVMLLASAQALNEVHIASSPWWPMHAAARATRKRPVSDRVTTSGIESAAIEPTRQPAAAIERRVQLSGYLIRLADGTLALDLPHQEMGAVRYLLRGDLVAKLEASLAGHKDFPSAGDIGSDGDTSGTLRGALGGGGYKRMATRFSPIAVQLTGMAAIEAVVHPNAADKVPERLRLGAQTDERLPWGGHLYRLQIESVQWTRTIAQWRKLDGQVRRKLAQARGLVQRGALDRAGSLLETQAERLSEPFPGASVPFARALRKTAAKLLLGDVEVALFKQVHPMLSRAIRCDRSTESTLQRFDAPFAAALRRCALSSYRRALNAPDERQREAATGRLIWLLERTFDAQQNAHRREAQSLRKRFPNARVQLSQPDPAQLVD